MEAARPADRAVIIDLDIGNDVDDTVVAVIVALDLRRFKPTLIITNDEGVSLGRLRFLREILSLRPGTGENSSDGESVPVAVAGLPSHLKHDDTLVEREHVLAQEESSIQVREDGIATLVSVMDHHQEVLYFGLGALSNLCCALHRAPSLASRISLVQMGPALAASYRQADRPQYNVRIDPSSFLHVMRTLSRPPRLLLSQTSWASFPSPSVSSSSPRQQLGLYPDDPLAAALRASPLPIHLLLSSHLSAWARSGKPCSIMHDPLTLLSHYCPSLVTWKEARVEMTETGLASILSSGSPSSASASSSSSSSSSSSIFFAATISTGADYDQARLRIVEGLFPSGRGLADVTAAALARQWGDYNAANPLPAVT